METISSSAEQKEKFGNNDCAILENVLAGHSEQVTFKGKTIASGPTTIARDYSEYGDVILKPPAILKKIKTIEDVNVLRQERLLPAGLLPMFESALGHLMIRGLTPILRLKPLDKDGKIDAIEVAFAQITRIPKALEGGGMSSVEEISVKQKEDWAGIDFSLATGFDEVFNQPQPTEDSMIFPVKTSLK